MLSGHDRGQSAASPREIPILGWKDILLRVWVGLRENRVVLIAGGAAFFLLLSLFPAISAFISIYGLFFNPRTAIDQVAALDTVLPEGASEIIRERLSELARQKARAHLPCVLLSILACFFLCAKFCWHRCGLWFPGR